jgi:hypothetical protein
VHTAAQHTPSIRDASPKPKPLAPVIAQQQPNDRAVLRPHTLTGTVRSVLGNSHGAAAMLAEFGQSACIRQSCAFFAVQLQQTAAHPEAVMSAERHGRASCILAVNSKSNPTSNQQAATALAAALAASTPSIH